ncbi:MAG TPA: DUF559 domain-containing protein [Candidatus Dormibacteraeota bacterium]|nr:DUF559 domain-containing protein [Candidatus Dormibacteraeota bacterium]
MPDGDVVRRRGFRITSALRTVRDLGSIADLAESVVAVDLALHARLLGAAEVASYIQGHAGAKGIKRLRRAAQLADERSESPMETRLRIALITAGLPTPCVQAELHDASGKFVGRADLYYPDRRLVIEYDGSAHRDLLVPDLRRQNALVNAGYHVLRYTAADLRIAGWVAAQVSQARDLLAGRTA